ncbi:hypothetical protein KM043_017719 [Ampulex compressa]|nr:hypothetical protein KM043_017719 [Ampulex compressa]
MKNSTHSLILPPNVQDDLSSSSATKTIPVDLGPRRSAPAAEHPPFLPPPRDPRSEARKIKRRRCSSTAVTTEARVGRKAKSRPGKTSFAPSDRPIVNRRRGLCHKCRALYRLRSPTGRRHRTDVRYTSPHFWRQPPSLRSKLRTERSFEILSKRVWLAVQ